MTYCKRKNDDVERELRRVLSRDLANANITIKVNNCSASRVITGETLNSSYDKTCSDLYVLRISQAINDAIKNLKKGEIQIFIREGRVEDILRVVDLT